MLRQCDYAKRIASIIGPAQVTITIMAKILPSRQPGHSEMDIYEP